MRNFFEGGDGFEFLQAHLGKLDAVEQLIPIAELGPLSQVEVATYLNGDRVRSAAVAGMRFSPASLLAFISQVMPLEPGDIVATGTPGAVVLGDGDVAECRVSGFAPLTNPVIKAP